MCWNFCATLTSSERPRFTYLRALSSGTPTHPLPALAPSGRPGAAWMPSSGASGQPTRSTVGSRSRTLSVPGLFGSISGKLGISSPRPGGLPTRKRSASALPHRNHPNNNNNSYSSNHHQFSSSNTTTTTNTNRLFISPGCRIPLQQVCPT